MTLPYDARSHASPARDAFAVAAPARPARAAGRGRGALPPPEPDPPAAGPSTPEPPRTADRLLAERGLLRAGLVISVALHVVFFLGLRAVWIEVPPDSRAGPPDAAAEVPGTRVVRLVETEGAAMEPDEPPPRDSEATPPAPTPLRPDEAPGPPGIEAAPARRRGVAERLRPSDRDPRLWSLPDAVDPAGLSPEDRRRVELAARIDALGDSAAAARSAAARAYDWTKEDGSGGKWGVSPGKIHLGKVTLPLPLLLGTSGPGSAEAARRAADWEAIQAQAARAGLTDDFDARVKAIRERKEQERKAQQGQEDPPPG